MPADNGKILVVDDQQRNREICQENLEMEGYGIIMAENGCQALEAARQQGPDLILLDIMMPEMDGYEVLQKLKADQMLQGIPVLMLTARASTEDVVKTLNMGANDYLKKPFDIDELVARVHTLVRLKKAEDKIRQSISKLEHQAALGIQAAGAAHDLNNILAVMTYHQLIDSSMASIQSEITPEQKQALADDFALIEEGSLQISETIKLGSEICRAITRFSHEENIGQRVQPVNPLIKIPLQLFSRRLKTLDINIQTDLEENCMITCDSGQIQRIMLNLLSNAVYAIEKKELSGEERRLDIALFSENQAVILTVSDSGTGIPEDILPRIFDAHFTTKGHKGSGIGLDTVKKIMAAHNGTIRAVSKPGKGTTFILTFPGADPIS